jgi:hypothetical protein
VIRINIPWLVQVSEALDGLSMVQGGQKITDVWYPLFNAKQNVESLSASVYNQHIRVSRQKAGQLLGEIDRLLNSGDDYSITEVDAWVLGNERNQFKQLFHAEVGSMPAYLVARKEGYDVELLVEFGTALFPLSLIQKAPEAERDAIQAGKALAFEVATGCGFHVFRVTEAVVKRYWDEVSGGAKRPKLQTLGNYAAEMEKRNFGDDKVIESIKQMTRLHRNPIIHPDVILTVEEAIGIVGMARSVIGAMLAVLPDVPPTTGAPAGAATP